MEDIRLYVTICELRILRIDPVADIEAVVKPQLREGNKIVDTLWLRKSFIAKPR